MKKRINERLLFIAVMAVIVTMISMTAIYYELFQAQVKKDLYLVAQTLEESGIFSQTEDVSALSGAFEAEGDELRLTWIDADGTVLYDNDADAASLPNHLDRPEVQEALSDGEGESVRRSDTMKTSTFYYALRLDNGTVLRVSTQTRNAFSVLLTALPYILLILAAVVLLCIGLASVLTGQLLRPIREMAGNMEDASGTPEYKELIPFMETIRKQHENILMAARVRQDFTANVSHELKTPLTAISGYAELIENHMAGPEQEARFAQEIQKNATRLLSLINDIIRLSELDSGEDNLMNMEQVDLDEIARACLSALRVNAEKRGVRIFYEGSPVVLRADRSMLAELVENLCQNAIRYNVDGGTVTVRVACEKSQPLLSVADTGIGIPKDQQERVFERFYRVDKSRSKETGGTGLGLAIVKHIVELHGAALTLESEPGQGTTVTVRF